MVLDSFPYTWRGGIERFRQVWRVALHPKFRPEVRLLSPFIPAGKGCLDIGANHGRFAIELARLGRRVLAFEPLEFNLAVLRPAMALSRRVQVVPCALGERQGNAGIYVPLRDDNRPVHGAAFVAGDDQEAVQHTVAMRLVRQRIDIQRLDDADLSWLGSVGFIKIDVEGHEPAVIRGGASVLFEHKPSILIECWPAADGIEALRELANIGYQFYDLDLCEDGGWNSDPAAVHACIAEAEKSHDVLAWHAGQGGPPAFAGSFALTRFGR